MSKDNRTYKGDQSESYEPGLSYEENRLLNTSLPYNLDADETEETWNRYQVDIGKLLVRMGREHPLLDSIPRLAWVNSRDGIYARIALVPTVTRSLLHMFRRYGFNKLVSRIPGEWRLMEVSGGAGIRTFNLRRLVQALYNTGEMEHNSLLRLIGTFQFLITMIRYPLNDPRVNQQLRRVNELHRNWKVAGAAIKEDRDFFTYIALNMFCIGPGMRPDITPQERQALYGLTVLVARRMGHTIEGSVKELEGFIRDYEDKYMFDPDDPTVWRKRAIRITRATMNAFDQIPIISRRRILGYIPYTVKKALEIE